MIGPVLRPYPGRDRSGRDPFFTNVSFTVEGSELVVTDEHGVRHTFAIGPRMGQVHRFGTVADFGLRGGFSPGVRGINAWLVVLDSTGTVLVAADLEQWDQEELHAWWCLLHDGQLEMYLTEPGAPRTHLPRAVEGRTLLLHPLHGTRFWLPASAWTLAVLFNLVPVFTDLPAWVGPLPVTVLIVWWVLVGAVRGRGLARHRADRMAALYAAIPPERLADEST